MHSMPTWAAASTAPWPSRMSLSSSITIDRPAPYFLRCRDDHTNIADAMFAGVVRSRVQIADVPRLVLNMAGRGNGWACRFRHKVSRQRKGPPMNDDGCRPLSTSSVRGWYSCPYVENALALLLRA